MSAGAGAQHEPPSARDHLANERTLLAWIRTALTVIGLGFIIDRLALGGAASAVVAWVGVALVLLGGVIAVAGGYSFLRARRVMATGRYSSTAGVHLALVAAVVLGAAVVGAFLLINRPL